MKLYDFELSGNCWKVRLLLSLLNRPYERIAVDLANGAHRTPEFRAKNPLGQVPVLEHDDVTLRDSQAILAYLAHGTDWLPSDPKTYAQTIAWLSTAANEVAHGPARMRLHKVFGAPLEQRTPEVTTNVLSVIEDHLKTREWLAGDRCTIADVAVYPYLKLAPDGGVDLSTYPAIQAWFQRVEALPGYVGLKE